MAADVLALLLVAAIAGAGGVAFGIVVIVPRLTRLIERREEPRDEPT